jgi:Ca2+-binding RTX toxin-like protein
VLNATVATASGLSGNDTVRNIENLTGSNYNDVFTGNSVANVLAGGGGNDRLDGKLGNDVLTGGAGSDTFVFTTAAGTSNLDRISDFAAGVDTIALENAVFAKLTVVGELNANNFKILGATPVDDTDYIQYNATTGALLYDADGSGALAAVQIALLGTGLRLTAADFDVI